MHPYKQLVYTHGAVPIRAMNTFYLSGGIQGRGWFSNLGKKISKGVRKVYNTGVKVYKGGRKLYKDVRKEIKKVPIVGKTLDTLADKGIDAALSVVPGSKEAINTFDDGFNTVTGIIGSGSRRTSAIGSRVRSRKSRVSLSDVVKKDKRITKVRRA